MIYTAAVVLTHLGVCWFCRGAALATVERLLNCTSPHDNNMTNDGKERIAIGGPAPWNTGGGATTEIASSAAAKEWQLVGES